MSNIVTHRAILSNIGLFQPIKARRRSVVPLISHFFLHIIDMTVFLHQPCAAPRRAAPPWPAHPRPPTALISDADAPLPVHRRPARPSPPDPAAPPARPGEGRAHASGWAGPGTIYPYGQETTRMTGAARMRGDGSLRHRSATTRTKAANERASWSRGEAPRPSVSLTNERAEILTRNHSDRPADSVLRGPGRLQLS